MAIPVERVHLAMAHAALPGLLPTPPATAVLPAEMSISVSPVLPAKSPSKAKPGRADAMDRWDEHKIKVSSPSSSSASASSGSSSSGPGRGGASSCDRWDSNKLPGSAASRASSSGKKPADSNSKRPAVSCSSSAERWDLHKKPRAEKIGGSGNKQDAYAGPGFLASPEPCMLPVPAFWVQK